MHRTALAVDEVRSSSVRVSPVCRDGWVQTTWNRVGRADRPLEGRVEVSPDRVRRGWPVEGRRAAIVMVDVLRWTYVKTARELSVSPSTVRRWHREYRLARSAGSREGRAGFCSIPPHSCGLVSGTDCGVRSII
ncbi:helix-turn-helix domain-containing protein [Saccharothrix hoggarensis]